MIYERSCPICGANVPIAKKRQKYCSDECRRTAVREESARKRIEARNKKNSKGYKLTIAATKAKQLGLSYGQYMAKYGAGN